MHLWNDYEGQTVAGAFPLERLLRTEGRSASFATRDRAGRTAVIRLTEALNDQERMRERYRAVQAAAHVNLVVIEDYGDAELEGTPLIYLVSEPTEETLGEVLAERRLSVEETNELATSLVGAVEALHEHGLIHGQIEPANVLAVGQVIKLRTDCVRPAPLGADGERERRDDVYALTDTLHRALAQQPLQGASDALALPEPYASIVRNVVRGTWGLSEVASELRRSLRPEAVPVVAPAPPVSSAAPAQGGLASPSVAAEIPSSRVEEQPSSGVGKSPARSRASAQLPLVYEGGQSVGVLRARADAPSQAPGIGRKVMVIAGGMVAVLLVAVPLWRSAFTHPSVAGPSQTASAAPPAEPSQPPSQPPPQSRPAEPGPSSGSRSPAGTVPGVAAKTAGASGGGKVWRVVAYTYNREDQAKAKVRFLMERHAALRPEVFSLTGGAPYLVVLGGALNLDQAASLRSQARSEGLPPDVYVQNYSK